MEFSHVPVLAEACMEGLAIRPNGLYVDATTGGGGHSALIAQRLETGRLICLDQDDDALAAAGRRLAEYADKITFIKTNFRHLKAVLAGAGVGQIDGILFDFGVSSWQLNSADRGFSYMQDAPLDMRMDRQAGLSARQVVNTYERAALQALISRYGEERFAPQIAAAIVARRAHGPIETTVELSELIKSAMPAAARREKQHPAKRTFQAIRIEVNDELGAAEQGVEDGVDLLAAGGRIAVITFHSLEDRLVKQIFARRAQGCRCPKELPVCVCGHRPEVALIAKGGVTPSPREIGENPRARSARLRIAEKL